jgi:hypothetical protein
MLSASAPLFCQRVDTSRAPAARALPLTLRAIGVALHEVLLLSLLRCSAPAPVALSIDRATHYAHCAADVALTKSIQPQGEIMKKIVIASLAVLVTTMALAYEIHHPNLRDAYGATENAIHHVQEAQAANKGIEFGGHAEKALEALRHAQQEIMAADQWNDAHHR